MYMAHGPGPADWPAFIAYVTGSEDLLAISETLPEQSAVNIDREDALQWVQIGAIALISVPNHDAQLRARVFNTHSPFALTPLGSTDRIVRRRQWHNMLTQPQRLV